MKSTSYLLLLFTLSYLPLFSQCEIGELEIDESACLNGEFSVIIDFDYANTSDSFVVRGNGQSYGCFAYEDLPITIDGLDGDCNTEYEFVAIDKDDDNCRNDGLLGEVCCACRIYEIEWDVTECNDHQEFSVELDFLYENTSDSFSITWRGMSQGCFAYTDLPISFGPFDGDCTTAYGFLIRDKEKSDCLEDFGIGEVCCEEECEIFDIEVDAIECNGDSCMVVELNFIHNATGSMGFDVFGRNGLIGHYQYNQLPLRIPCFPLSGSLFELVEICDREFPDCCGREEFEALVCDSSCVIDDLVVEAFGCDSLDNYLVEIDFEHHHVGDSFKLIVNGLPYGTYSYDSLAIIAGPIEGGCDSRNEFVVRDCLDSLCADTVVVEGRCCDEKKCRIYEIEYELTECDSNDMFEVVVNFHYEHVSDSFQIEYDGNILGCYAYGDLPVRFGPFEGDCETEYGFIIRDKENGDCLEDFGIGEVCCNECRLFELVVEPFDCDTNHTFLLEIDFLYENTSDSFDVTVNGHDQGRFAYDSLAIVIGRLEGGCDSRHEIEICDSENEDCCVEVVIEGTCCDMGCSIGELEAEALECNGDSCLYVKVDFEHSGTGENFNVYDRNGLIGTYSYGLLPLTIDCYPISGFDQEYIRVCDEDQEDCCAVLEFDGLDCTTIGTFDLEDLGWTVNYSFPTSTITLENKGTSASIEMYLFNIEGKQMVQRKYQSTDTLDISHLKSGVYVVAVNVGGYIEHKKIVKL